MSGAAAAGVDLEGISIAHGATQIFAGFDLSIRPGEFLCLLGASGTGKSTLLRAITGLMAPSAGAVRRWTAVSLMTQDDALLPWAGPLGNVTIGSRLRGEKEDREKAQGLLVAVGLGGVTGRPDTLAGGMRKRVALARLLYEDRPIALLDEPFAALDAITRREVQDVTLRMLRGRTVVMVTHDPYEAIAMADRIGVIAGRPARLTLDVAMPASPGGALRDPGSPGLYPLYRRILEAIGVRL